MRRCRLEYADHRIAHFHAKSVSVELNTSGEYSKRQAVPRALGSQALDDLRGIHGNLDHSGLVWLKTIRRKLGAVAL